MKSELNGLMDKTLKILEEQLIGKAVDISSYSWYNYQYTRLFNWLFLRVSTITRCSATQVAYATLSTVAVCRVPELDS